MASVWATVTDWEATEVYLHSDCLNKVHTIDLFMAQVTDWAVTEDTAQVFIAWEATVVTAATVWEVTEVSQLKISKQT